MSKFLLLFILTAIYHPVAAISCVTGFNVSNNNIDFGTVDSNKTKTETITVTTYCGTVNMSALPALQAPFSIQNDNCSNQNISGTCTFDIVFSPSADGTFSETNYKVDATNATESYIDMTGVGNFINSAPNAFDLVYPANVATNINTDVTVKWKKTTDPDGDEVEYDLYVCEDSTFAACDVIEVPSISSATIATGLTGIFFAIILLSLLIKNKKKLFAASIGVCLLGSLVFMSCDKTNESSTIDSQGVIDDSPVGADEVAYKVTNLARSTTYYWKVVAKDDASATTESEVYSFTTY